MTYHIISLSSGPSIGSSSPLIKANERATFCNAVELLSAVQTVHSTAQTDADALRESAYQAGLAQGRAEARDHVMALIKEASVQIDNACVARRQDIAETALAATQAIIGAIDDREVIARLVSQALTRVDTSADVVVDVAPDMHSAVAEHLAGLAYIRVESNAALGPLDCSITAANGRVIASLDVQLAGLAQRWGVAAS